MSMVKKYPKPKSYDNNLIVIGAGSAGLVTSYIAAVVKAKVTLIEKHKMGGDCLNTGCVPSKAFIRSAKIFNYLQRAGEFGLNFENPKVDFAKVMSRVQGIIEQIEPHDSVQRYTELGVNCVQGEAKIVSPYCVEVNGKPLTTRSIVIATGAGPLIPSLPGLDGIEYLTSDTVWDLKALPKKLLILGGGPIGCELAQSFARLGAEVTLVGRAPRIMPREDEEVSQYITECFISEGIQILTDHQAVEFKVKSSCNVLLTKHNDEIKEIVFDKVLLALGRKPNIEEFGLEELGVSVSNRGTVAVNNFLQTNYPNIFACGDVAGPYQFTHMAAFQAWYAAVNALFGRFKKFKVNYSVVPWATFTDPEVARVGLSEQEAERQSIPYELVRFGIDDLDRAIADSVAHGFIKVLTVPGKDKILGVTIVGHHAGDLISEYVLAMTHKLGLNKVLGTIHIYPTLAESNRFVAGEWKRAHAPEKVLKLLSRFHRWLRH